MAEYMEKLSHKTAEKLRIWVGGKKKEEKVIPEELVDEIPAENPSGYAFSLNTIIVCCSMIR